MISVTEFVVEGQASFILSCTTALMVYHNVHTHSYLPNTIDTLTSLAELPFEHTQVLSSTVLLKHFDLVLQVR